MRHSPARAHYQQSMAAAQQPENTEQPRDQNAANAYELMLAKLAGDKRRLKAIQSMELKAALKLNLLPDYADWIAGVLEGDNGCQDDVLMTVFVWAVDAGQFSTALDIGDYALRHNLVMPDQYQRDVPCVLAEEIADFALKLPEEQLLGLRIYLERAIDLTDGKDMPDQVRAKLYKASGYALRAAGELAQARERLVRAFELFDKVGVKKDIERLDTLIKNSSPAVDAEKTAETGSA